MALSTHVGREVTPVADGNVAYTGVGFQPKVLLFWYGNASGNTQANYNVGFGAAVSASSRFATHSLSIDNSTTGPTWGWHFVWAEFPLVWLD